MTNEVETLARCAHETSRDAVKVAFAADPSFIAAVDERITALGGTPPESIGAKGER